MSTDLEYTHCAPCPHCGRSVAAGTRCTQRVPITDQNGVEVGIAVVLNPHAGPTQYMTMRDIYAEMLEGQSKRKIRKVHYSKPDCASRPVELMDFVLAGMTVGVE